jgi:hypothetical protein
MPEYIDLQNIEPKVVELNLHGDFPAISVRMPIYRMVTTHETSYFELIYKTQFGGEGKPLGITCTLHLSSELIHGAAASGNLMDRLPLMSEEEFTRFSLGGVRGGWSLDDVLLVLNKLKQFHASLAWKKYFLNVIGRGSSERPG